MNDFAVKDSGARMQFGSGMIRDTEEGKLDYTLILDGPMLDRWAEHLTKGAQKYSARNWMQAAGPDEWHRFRRSFLRHALQWLRGERDEDHAAAMFFNVNGAEYVFESLEVPTLVAPPGTIIEVDPTKCLDCQLRRYHVHGA